MRLAHAVAVLALAAALAGPVSRAAADGPVAYWRLGEASGTVAHDSAGSSNGTYVGGVTLGRPGAVSGDSAVELNGTSGYIRVPHTAALDTGDSFSVDLWVKLARTGAGQGLASNGGYLIALDSAGHVLLRKPNAGTVVTSTTAINDTTGWHHVLVTKAGGEAHIYIDDVDRSGPVTNRTIASTTGALVLGAGAGYLKGSLDEVKVYSSAISPVAPVAAPSTLYVDEASVGGPCSDTRAPGDVSLITPLCSIDAALPLIADGGTIYVRDGTYPKVTVTRAFGARTTITGYGTETPQLAGDDLQAPSRNIRIQQFRITDISMVEGQHIELIGNDMSPNGVYLDGSDNLAEDNYIHDLRITFDPNWTGTRCHTYWRLDNGNDLNHDGQYDIPLTETGGVYPWCGFAFRTKGSNNVIRGNVVRKVPADGVQATSTSNLLVEGNHFENIGIQTSADGGDPLEHPDGAQMIGSNANATFRDNVYIDTRGILSMVYDRDNTWPTNLTVENNVFDTVSRTSGLDGAGNTGCIHASAVTGMTIVNNTCWGQGAFSPPIRVTDDGNPVSQTTGVVLRNNIVERYITDPGIGVQEDYNLIGSYQAAPGQGPGQHTIIGQPTFVPGDLLLRLDPASLGIDAGTSDGAPATDREGNPRCGPVDMGAEETNPASGTCPVPTQPPPTAVSLWQLDESSGSTAQDSAGSNPGTYAGGVTLGQPGAVTGGTAVALDGSSGYIRIPHSSSLDTGDAFSVAMWVKLARTGAGQGLASNGAYLIALDSAGRVMLRKPNAGGITTSTAAITDTTTWHHVIVTKDGASTHIYIDGTDRTGTVTNRTITNTTGPLLLGTGAGYLRGSLDNVAIYPRALTAAEAAALP